MIAIPVPFVISLVLAMLIGQMLLSDSESGQRWPLILFLAVALLQSIIVGLRWNYGFVPARLLQPVTAALLPPLAYWAVNDLRRQTVRWSQILLLPVAIALGIAILMSFWPYPIDAILLALYLTYGVAIIAIGLKSPDDLTLARLEDVGDLRAASLLLGGLMISGAALDGLVAIDIELLTGNGAPILVSVFNLLTLLACALATIRIGQGRPVTSSQPAGSDAGEPEPLARIPAPEAVDGDATEADDVGTLAAVDALLREQALYRDADLTLDRLARRAHLPARAISGAINRVHRQNVSQHVNGFRIAEAQALLRDTDRPVTAILFDVGFQTKSNFNREFRRIAGCSPSDWRNGAAAADATDRPAP